MPLYLSTGRKPSQQTRKVARLLSLILGAKYENRGKRSVDDICARAEQFGCDRIAFIYEKKGNPNLIQFYDEETGWLDEELLVFGINLPEREGRIGKEIAIETADKDGERMAGLLCLENKEENEKSHLRGAFSDNKIQFFAGEQPVLEIKCKLAVNKVKSQE